MMLEFCVLKHLSVWILKNDEMMKIILPWKQLFFIVDKIDIVNFSTLSESIAFIKILMHKNTELLLNHLKIPYSSVVCIV